MSCRFVSFFDASNGTYEVFAVRSEALRGSDLMVVLRVVYARLTHARPAAACRIPENGEALWIVPEELTRRDA